MDKDSSNQIYVRPCAMSHEDNLKNGFIKRISERIQNIHDADGSTPLQCCDQCVKLTVSGPFSEGDLNSLVKEKLQLQHKEFLNSTLSSDRGKVIASQFSVTTTTTTVIESSEITHNLNSTGIEINKQSTTKTTTIKHSLSTGNQTVKANQLRSQGDDIYETAESPEQFDEARHYYEEAVSLDESLRPQLQERLNHLEKIERSQRAQAYECRADSALGKKRFKESCDLYKIAMRSAVVNTPLYLRIREKEDYVTKIMCLETANHLAERGEDCLKNNSYQQAKELFTQAMKLNPEYIHLQSIITSIEKTITAQASAQKVNEGNAAMKVGKYKYANQLYLEAIALVPQRMVSLKPLLDSLVALMQAEEALIKQKSGLLALEDKKYSQAITLITEAIQLLPAESTTEHAFFLCDRALVYFEMKQFETSILDCHEALKLRPDLAIAYLRLGSAQFELNLYDEATISYDKVIRNDPTLSEQVKVKVRQVNTAKEILRRKEREMERARQKEEEKKLLEEKRIREEQLKKEKMERLAIENAEKLERQKLKEEEKRMKALIEKELQFEKLKLKELEKEQLKKEKAEKEIQKALDRERQRVEKEKERERIRMEKEQKILDDKLALQEEQNKQKEFAAELERAEAKLREIEREKEAEREKARMDMERLIIEREKIRQEKQSESKKNQSSGKGFEKSSSIKSKSSHEGVVVSDVVVASESESIEVSVNPNPPSSTPSSLPLDPNPVNAPPLLNSTRDDINSSHSGSQSTHPNQSMPSDPKKVASSNGNSTNKWSSLVLNTVASSSSSKESVTTATNPVTTPYNAEPFQEISIPNTNPTDWNDKYGNRKVGTNAYLSSMATLTPLPTSKLQIQFQQQLLELHQQQRRQLQARSSPDLYPNKLPPKPSNPLNILNDFPSLSEVISKNPNNSSKSNKFSEVIITNTPTVTSDEPLQYSTGINQINSYDHTTDSVDGGIIMSQFSDHDGRYLKNEPPPFLSMSNKISLQSTNFENLNLNSESSKKSGASMETNRSMEPQKKSIFSDLNLKSEIEYGSRLSSAWAQAQLEATVLRMSEPNVISSSIPEVNMHSEIQTIPQYPQASLEPHDPFMKLNQYEKLSNLSPQADLMNDSKFFNFRHLNANVDVQTSLNVLGDWEHITETTDTDRIVEDTAWMLLDDADDMPTTFTNNSNERERQRMTATSNDYQKKYLHFSHSTSYGMDFNNSNKELQFNETFSDSFKPKSNDNSWGSFLAHNLSSYQGLLSKDDGVSRTYSSSHILNNDASQNQRLPFVIQKAQANSKTSMNSDMNSLGSGQMLDLNEFNLNASMGFSNGTLENTSKMHSNLSTMSPSMLSRNVSGTNGAMPPSSNTSILQSILRNESYNSMFPDEYQPPRYFPSSDNSTSQNLSSPSKMTNNTSGIFSEMNQSSGNSIYDTINLLNPSWANAVRSTRLSTEMNANENIPATSTTHVNLSNSGTWGKYNPTVSHNNTEVSNNQSFLQQGDIHPVYLQTQAADTVSSTSEYLTKDSLNNNNLSTIESDGMNESHPITNVRKVPEKVQPSDSLDCKVVEPSKGTNVWNAISTSSKINVDNRPSHANNITTELHPETENVFFEQSKDKHHLSVIHLKTSPSPSNEPVVSPSTGKTSNNPTPRSSDTSKITASTPVQNIHRVIDVPKELIGLVIGHKGSKIKEISEVSGAKIHLKQSKFHEKETKNGVFEMQGTKNDVDQCVKIVNELLQTAGKEYSDIILIPRELTR